MWRVHLPEMLWAGLCRLCSKAMSCSKKKSLTLHHAKLTTENELKHLTLEPFTKVKGQKKKKLIKIWLYSQKSPVPLPDQKCMCYCMMVGFRHLVLTRLRKEMQTKLLFHMLRVKNMMYCTYFYAHGIRVSWQIRVQLQHLTSVLSVSASWKTYIDWFVPQLCWIFYSE